VQAFRPRPIDLAAAALLALVGAAEHAAAGFERWPLGLGPYLLAAGALAFARAAPLLLPPLLGVLYATAGLAGFDVSQPASWLPLVAAAAFAAGAYAPRARWPLGLGAVLVALGLLYGALEWLTEFEPSVLFGLALSVGPWALGLALRAALDRERDARAAAERARIEGELARGRAVAAERERIAAELHDVLAHALGAMVLQASAAAELVGRRPGEARRVLSGVASAGQEALAETGRLLRILRAEHEGRLAPPQEPEQETADRRPAVGLRDAALPLLFAAVATTEIVANGYGPLWAMLGSVWLACGVLVLRRALPLAMPLAVPAIFLAPRLVGGEPNELASLLLVGGLAVFAAGRHVPPRRLGLGLAAVLVAGALSAADVVTRGELAADLILVFVLALAPWAVGAALRASLARTGRHAAAAERARLEAEVHAADAVAADRRRIARELHDLLASSLGVMTVQASAAAELVPADPARAAAAVAEVERAGRAALAGGGRLLRLVREDDRNGTVPQPGLAELAALADDCARAGLEVELEDAALGRVPAGVAVSLYRIVQEALTNALKHAPGSRVRVRLSRGPGGVAVEVANGRPGSPPRTIARSGHGLTGLRERVEVFGGTLEAGPTPEGGFRLAATIPLAESS
jgi:signal transduction histidine kinase